MSYRVNPFKKLAMDILKSWQFWSYLTVFLIGLILGLAL